MKIFCKFPTVNISERHFWLVICTAKNFIWTTLKVIFSIFIFLAPSDSRFSNSCIPDKYGPICPNLKKNDPYVLCPMVRCLFLFQVYIFFMVGPWFTNEMLNVLSSEKRTLEHWAPVQFFSLSQVRCFWWCFWFRSGLVDLFLKMSERGDSWFSFSSLLVKFSQVFESALLDCILKLAVISVACAHFPSQFLPSSQLCI